jgi:hypothetical protein
MGAGAANRTNGPARIHVRLRHPSEGKNITVRPWQGLQGPEFQTLQIHDVRRMHVSCEGLTVMLNCGSEQLQVDPLQSYSRVRSEFLMTYLFALHHAVMCRDMNRQSYTSQGGRRETDFNYENLLMLLQEFDRDFNFAVVSTNMTTQSLYRTAREVTGADATHQQIKDELQGWLDSEQRAEDRKLNAFALVAMAVSFCTFFVGLNIYHFTHESEIKMDELKSLWLWVPIALVALSTLSAPLRGYYKIAFKAIFGRR